MVQTDTSPIELGAGSARRKRYVTFYGVQALTCDQHYPIISTIHNLWSAGFILEVFKTPGFIDRIL